MNNIKKELLILFDNNKKFVRIILQFIQYYKDIQDRNEN